MKPIKLITKAELQIHKGSYIIRYSFVHGQVFKEVWVQDNVAWETTVLGFGM